MSMELGQIQSFINDENQNKKNIKALAILSGGIDSSLAAKLVSEFGIEVIGISFPSPFCICNMKSSNYECAGLFFAEKIGLPFEMKAKENDYLEILKQQIESNPDNVEICIECKVYIFKKVKEYMQEIGAQFIITGEILGSKPNPKTIDLLMKIDKMARVEGLVLRPFSASYLPETIPEREGWVNRQTLLEMQGKIPNIKYSPGKKVSSIRNFCSSEGCLVIEKNFAPIMQDYLKHSSNPNMQEVELLKIGTHFRFKGVKLVHSESAGFKNIIECNKQRGYLLSFHQNQKGVIRYVYVDPTDDIEIMEFAEQLCAFYPKVFSKEEEIQRVDLSGEKASLQKKITNNKIKFKKYKL